MADKATKNEKSAKKSKGFIAGIKGFFSRTAKYFRDVKSEMKKVVWPSKTQIINNSIVVLVVMIISAIVILLLDLLFGEVMHLVLQAAASL